MTQLELDLTFLALRYLSVVVKTVEELHPGEGRAAAFRQAHRMLFDLEEAEMNGGNQAEQ